MSGKSKKDESQMKTKDARHYFFLNPYDDMAFTRCPKCEKKRKLENIAYLFTLIQNIYYLSTSLVDIVLNVILSLSNKQIWKDFLLPLANRTYQTS